MAGVQDLGNGLGYVYMTEPDGVTITAVAPNNFVGARQFKINGTTSAPVASNKSAYGVIEFTSITGIGDISGVGVNAIDQIAAPITITGLTTSQVADLVANSINSFTPSSGYDYFAVSSGSFVYIFAPPSAGAIPNGYAITVATAPGAIATWTTTNFANGANDQGVYDTVFGSRFFLNADYGPLGISGEQTADATSLANSVEITKYYVTRGQQLGIFVKSVTEQSNTLSGIDRSGFMTKVMITPNVSPSATVVKINPDDFVEGDFVILQPSNPGDTITVESAPAVTVPVAGNIYLTNDVPWTSDRYNVLMLQYKYVIGIGSVFTELSRSQATPPDIYIGKTLYVSTLGADASAIAYNLNHHYSTITAAKNAALSGDTIVVFPGTYTEFGLFKDGVNYHFMNGAKLVCNGGSAWNVNSDSTFSVTGDLEITSTSSISAIYVDSPNCNVSFELKRIDVVGNGLFLRNGKITVNVKEDVRGTNTCVYARSNGTLNLSFKADKLIWTGNSTLSQTSVNFFTGCVYMLNGSTGKVVIDVNEMSCLYGGTNMIGFSGARESTIIKCKKIVNNFTTYPTLGLFVANTVNYLRVEANIYSGIAGSKAAGIWSSVQENTNYNQYVEFFGDIYVDTNYAMYVNNGPAVLRYTGNMWGNNDGTMQVGATWPGGIPNGTGVNLTSLVYLGRQVIASNPNTVYQLYFKDCSLNQMATGANCIYKTQALLMPGSVETSQRLQLQNVSMYVFDAGAGVCIDGDFTAVNNDVNISACVSNAPVSANITELGDTIVNDATMMSYYDNAYFNL